MFKKILFPVLLAFVGVKVNAQVNIQWTDRFTRVGNNTDKAEDIALDAAGNVYICGTTWNGTSYDFLTVKYNSAGVLQWDTTYNGAGNSIDEARAIAVDANGNVFVTGASYFSSGNDDYLTIKYNSSGVPQWIKNYDGPGATTDEAWDIALDNAGNVFVTGGSTGSGTGEDYATIKYDPATGNQLALVRYSFTGNNIDRAQSIAIDATGNVYVTGYSYGNAAKDLDYATLKYTNALVAVWGSASRYNGVGSRIDQAKNVHVSATGNVFVTGYSNNTYILDDDITTVMYNSAGIQQWVNRYGAGNNQQDRGYAVTTDASDNSYVVGMVKNSGTNQDMVTIKYDVTGVQKWATEYNGPANAWDEARSCVLEPTGTYLYVTGFSQSPGTNQDVTTAKYATIDGSQQWLANYSYNGSNVDQGYSIAIDANENVFVAGQSNGGSSNTGNDALTLKYCQLTANAGNDVSMCLGANTQLNASATNAQSYAWAPATALTSTTIANPIANPTVTTTYTVVITNTSGCTDLDSVTVTVYPLPAPAISPSGPTTFCQGGTVNLCSATYLTYSWTPGGATTQCLNVNTSGTYSVLVTDTNTCASQSSIAVVVNPNPVANAGADTSVCLSHTAQLHASGGVSYVWSPSGTLSDATVSNPQAGMVVTTTYTVVVTSGAGCTAEDSVTVTIVGNPPVPSLNYNTATGVLCSSTASCYQWYQSPSTLINGATSQCYSPPANGTYYVVVCNSAGCTTASATYNVNNIGIGEIDNYFGSSVFPNPNSGSFTLQMAISSEQNITVKIFDVMGQEVADRNIGTVIGDVTELFDLSGQAKGLYFIQISSDAGVATRRIIIE